MNYTVLQVQVSRAVFDQVGKIGREAAMKQHPEYHARMEVMLDGSEGFLSWMSEYYDAVCDVDANSLDQVFKIGNIGPESKIVRKKPMHSVSVGDIIRCNRTGTFHMVDGIGFTQLLSFTNPAYQKVVQ
jgi:hypothetical protein